MPASPVSTTTPPSPAGVLAQRRRRTASSGSRPTNGRSSRRSSTAGSGTVAASAGRRRRLALQQQPVVQRGDVRRRRRAELVAQQHAQLVVDAQRLGDVAARRQQLHQHRVARLAVGLALDQRPRRALRGGQLARPEPQRRARQRLERVGVQPVDRRALFVDPAAGELGQQRPLEQRQRGLGAVGRAPRVAAGERHLGVGGRCAGRLDVEPRVGQREPQVRAALDGVRPERAPQPGQQRGQPRIRRAGRVLVPDHVDELVPPHRPLAVEREVGEQQPPLAARQVFLDPAPVDLDGESAAQLNSCGHGRAAVTA